jgi:hypothetical protein
MKKAILQQAYEELNDAVEHYEEEQAGLGLRMMDEIDKHVQWIMQNPTVSRVRKGGYRRVNLKTFPYYIAIWFVQIHYGFLPLLTIIANLSIGLQERTKSSKALVRTQTTNINSVHIGTSISAPSLMR